MSAIFRIGRHRRSERLLSGHSRSLCLAIIVFWFAACLVVASAREKDSLQYGEGLIVNIPSPVTEVTQAVEDVAGNGLIRGTKEYNKDEFVSGAEAVESTPAFATWTDPGKVFYKIRKHAIDPRNFKDGGDAGTLAVRYVVQPQGDTNTVLRVDAVFVEDFRHTSHPSNGSVETSEYKDIQDHIAAIELLKKETADAEQAKREPTRQNFGMGENTELLSTPAALSTESSSRTTSLSAPNVPPTRGTSMIGPDAGESSEEHLARLRREVERLVKKPGAPLKSAPFHTASTLKSLDPATEVLIVIVTPYWFGVETHDGQHGWIQRDQLESLP